MFVMCVCKCVFLFARATFLCIDETVTVTVSTLLVPLLDSVQCIGLDDAKVLQKLTGMMMPRYFRSLLA